MLTSNLGGSEVTAAELFVLKCIAARGTGVYSYQWTSTCDDGCVLKSGIQVTSMITRIAARSADSGIYTCTVIDNAGNNGTNAIEVQVTGMRLA